MSLIYERNRLHYGVSEIIGIYGLSIKQSSSNAAIKRINIRSNRLWSIEESFKYLYTIDSIVYIQNSKERDLWSFIIQNVRVTD